MKWYLNVIKYVKNLKNIVSDPENVESLYFDFLKKAEIFLIHPNSKQDFQTNEEKRITNLDFSLPFPCLSIETAGGYISQITIEDKSKDICWFGLKETSPTKYDIYLLSRVNGEYYLEYVMPGDNVYSTILKYAASMVSLINLKESIHGVEKLKKYVYFNKKRNEYRKINRVIHIHPDKKAINIQTENKGIQNKIEWSHTWSVRGHWRRHDGIGKDRAGNYCVEGFTFVREHVRGEGEEVKKIRVVHT